MVTQEYAQRCGVENFGWMKEAKRGSSSMDRAEIEMKSGWGWRQVQSLSHWQEGQ
jgi:hypothetical protein